MGTKMKAKLVHDMALYLESAKEITAREQRFMDGYLAGIQDLREAVMEILEEEQEGEPNIIDYLRSLAEKYGSEN